MTGNRPPVERVRLGGLFRCCVQHAESTAGQEGDRLTCPHCGSIIRYRNYAWEWTREFPVEEAPNA